MGFSFDGVTSKSMGIASRMTTENRVPELKNRTISMAGRDGLVDLGASLSERVIEISCFIPPKRTMAALLECKDEIVSWLSPDKGVCELKLDTEPGRVYYARLQSGVTFERVVRLASAFDLAFFCPDPFGYAAEDEVFTITEAGSHTVRRRLGNLYSNPVYRLRGVLASGAGRYISITTNGAELKIVLLLSWIVTNLLSYAVTNLSDKSACICQKYIFNRLIALFMRIPHGCQGRQRRLYSLDSHVEYAYTLAAIDKLESKEGHFTHNPVKVPKIPPLLRV